MTTSVGISLYPEDGDDADDAPAQRRHRPLPREGARPEQLPALHAGPQRGDPRAARPRVRPPARGRERRVRPPLPAGGRSSRPGRSSARRRSCAGSTRSAASSRPTPSSRSRRTRASSSRWASGSSARPAAGGPVPVRRPAGAWFVAVNLSARQFQRGSLVRTVEEALAGSGLAAGPARARDHGERRDGRHPGDDRDAPAAARDRRPRRPRRLRHGPLVARLPQEPSPRRDQDRPDVRRRDPREPARTRRSSWRSSRWRAASPCASSPRASRRRSSSPSSGERLPAGPGLPLRTARARRRGGRPTGNTR